MARTPITQFMIGDRYSYVAIVGLLAAAAVAFSRCQGIHRRWAGSLFLAWTIAAIACNPPHVARWQDSRTFWESALAATPDSVVGWRLLGNAWLSEDPDRAMEAYERAIAVAPNDDRPLMTLARLEYLTGDLESAANHFALAISMGNREPRAFHNLALIHIQLDSWERADGILRAARDRGAGSAAIEATWLTVGDEKAAAGDAERAITAYKRATAFMTSPAEAWRRLAKMYRDAGDVDAAEEAERRATP
jgi:tetratricopeptide (TPR) repeat protein